MKRLCLLLCAIMLLTTAAAVSEQTEPYPAPFPETKTGELGIIAIESRELEDDELQAFLPFAGRKIGIDPGHQAKANLGKEAIAPGSSTMKTKVTGGTRGTATKRLEHEINLEVSLKLKEKLEKLGAQVYLTRDTAEVDISNCERAAMMNDLGVDLVLRIHCNGSTNKNSNGIGLYVRATGTDKENCLRLAECLMPEMTKATGAKNNGIHRTDTYTGNNWSVPPCVLVEMGFLTNPEEDRKLNDTAYQDSLAEGMIAGIADFYGLTE